MNVQAYLARQNPLHLLGAVVILGLGVYVLKNGVAGATAGVVKTALDVPAGAVIGIGDSLGIPRTEMTECQRALAEGRTWDASFACPAGTFLRGWLFGPNGPSSTN